MISVAVSAFERFDLAAFVWMIFAALETDLIVGAATSWVANLLTLEALEYGFLELCSDVF